MTFFLLLKGCNISDTLSIILDFILAISSNVSVMSENNQRLEHGYWIPWLVPFKLCELLVLVLKRNGISDSATTT